MMLVPEKLRINVEVFEGPLDLLLYLIRRDDLDIYDIPIAHITQEYLTYLELLEVLNLDLAGEFLVMAATLAQIKSKMLLPRPEGEDEKIEEDPREELIRRLLEYQRYKEASKHLEDREILEVDVFARPPEPVSEKVPLAEEKVDVTLFEMVSALKYVLSRLPEKKYHEVVRESISITQRIYEVIDNLKGRERVEFLDLFQDVTSRSLVVLTFLSILELMKRKLIKCQQALPGSIIHIFPVGNFDDLGNTSFEEDYAYDAPKDGSPEETEQELDEEPEDKLDEPL